MRGGWARKAGARDRKRARSARGGRVPNERRSTDAVSRGDAAEAEATRQERPTGARDGEAWAARHEQRGGGPCRGHEPAGSRWGRRGGGGGASFSGPRRAGTKAREAKTRGGPGRAGDQCARVQGARAVRGRAGAVECLAGVGAPTTRTGAARQAAQRA